jgi:hypothetical protein
MREIRSVRLHPNYKDFEIKYRDGTSEIFERKNIQHLECPNNLDGARITQITTFKVGEIVRSKTERLSVYHLRFRTTMGDIVLEMHYPKGMYRYTEEFSEWVKNRG